MFINQINTFFAKDRKIWRKWLQKNSAKEKSIWLINYKKNTGKECVSYNEAVEEAVCFGWIDGQVRSIDKDSFIQRYTPRTSKSMWSETNIARAQKMIKAGLMTKTGLKTYKDAMRSKRTVPSVKNFTVTEYFKKELRANKKAWENFQKLPRSQQLMYVYWVDSAKLDETRKIRLKKILKLLLENKSG